MKEMIESVVRKENEKLSLQVKAQKSSMSEQDVWFEKLDKMNADLHRSQTKPSTEIMDISLNASDEHMESEIFELILFDIMKKTALPLQLNLNNQFLRILDTLSDGLSTENLDNSNRDFSSDKSSQIVKGRGRE